MLGLCLSKIPQTSVQLFRISGKRLPLLRYTITPSRYALTSRFAQSRAAKNLEHSSPPLRATPPKLEPEQPKTSEHPILKRTPKFLHRYFGRVLTAPGSHIIAFIVLHEITAIVPLFGLWYTFHHYGFVPTGLPDWMLSKGVDFINVLAEKYNWGLMSGAANSTKVLMEGAAAYSIVKLTLPIRAAFSIMLMPWFARILVLPVTGLFKRKKPVAAGTVNNNPGPKS